MRRYYLRRDSGVVCSAIRGLGARDEVGPATRSDEGTAQERSESRPGEEEGPEAAEKLELSVKKDEMRNNPNPP